MDVNKLNDAWIKAGQDVEDFNAKLNTAVMDDSFDEEKFKDLKKQRDNKVSQRNALHEQLQEAREDEQRAMDLKKKAPVTTDYKPASAKDEFVRGIKNLVTSSQTGKGNGGLTIPEDIDYQIRQYQRQFVNLQSLVRVENVTVPTGQRTYQKLEDITPLVNLDDETALIPDNDDPSVIRINYKIKRYAGMNTITNTLMADSVDNILAWIIAWIGKKDTATRNTSILSVLNAASKKPSITKFDDIKDIELTALDPALIPGSVFLTNQTGFGVLSKIKDAEGRYLLQSDPTQADTWKIGSHQVIYVNDKQLPDVSGSHPLYFGNFNEAVTLYDRQNMSLTTTNVGAGSFEHDETKIRVIDRFDVEQIDPDAYLVGSFTSIADQKPISTAGTTTAANADASK